jgi:hypothetical protein
MRLALGDPEKFSPVPCCTDNRMHRWEWVCSAGKWFKFDSLDHHAAHDLVGCQDIAWDIAGAAVEFALSPEERARLIAGLEGRLGRLIAPQFVEVYELAYLGFQIGLWTMAKQRNNENEAHRIEQQLMRYDQRLRELGIV